MTATMIKDKLLDKIPGAGNNGKQGLDSAAQDLLKKVSALDKIDFLNLLETHDTGLGETEVDEKLFEIIFARANDDSFDLAGFVTNDLMKRGPLNQANNDIILNTLQR